MWELLESYFSVCKLSFIHKLLVYLKNNLESGNFQRDLCRKFQFHSSSSLFSSFPAVKEKSTLPEAKLWKHKAGAKAIHDPSTSQGHPGEEGDQLNWWYLTTLFTFSPFSYSY